MSEFERNGNGIDRLVESALSSPIFERSDGKSCLLTRADAERRIRSALRIYPRRGHICMSVTSAPIAPSLIRVEVLWICWAWGRWIIRVTREIHKEDGNLPLVSMGSVKWDVIEASPQTYDGYISIMDAKNRRALSPYSIALPENKITNIQRVWPHSRVATVKVAESGLQWLCTPHGSWEVDYPVSNLITAASLAARALGFGDNKVAEIRNLLLRAWKGDAEADAIVKAESIMLSLSR